MGSLVARMVAKRMQVATKHVGLISGPRVSVVQGCSGAGLQDQGAGGVQWWRVQGRSAVVAGAGQECSLQISSQ